MVKPRFRPNVKEMLGEDFSKLLYEVAPFVEPRIDIFESNGYFIILADVAGARNEDLSVKLQQNTLLIEGTIHNFYIAKNIKIINSERYYGSFTRAILIPESCIPGQLNAVLERGILLITIPLQPNNIHKEIKNR